MATWTNITDAALEPGRPIRSVDGLALRDNAIAIAEGAVGAPRVLSAAINDYPFGAEDFQTGTTERDWVLARTAGANVGAVGSYATAKQATGTTVSTGGVTAGSNLRYSDSSSNAGGSLPGTWRLMGNSYVSGESSTWLRIS